MDLSPYVDSVRHELELAIVAGAGGEDATGLAERLTAPLESALRLTLLEALSAAADEITRELAPGSVDVRLRGRDPDFVVTLRPAGGSLDQAGGGGFEAEVGAVGPLPSPEAQEGGISRINLRLPDNLKVRIEEAAGRERLSVNAWVVRAVAASVDHDNSDRRPRWRGPQVGQHYTGWVR